MSNNLKKKWNQNEIDFLKIEFTKGTKIKIIAAMLGKTETAVNKFLTRCGIRPTRHNKNVYNLLHNKYNCKNDNNIAIYANKFGSHGDTNTNLQQLTNEIKAHNLVNNSSNIKKRHYNSSNPRWTILLNDIVDFKEVINYLKSKNYKVSTIMHKNIKLFYPNSEYILNGYPVSKTKLLILANKLREEENKNCFKLEPII